MHEPVKAPGGDAPPVGGPPATGFLAAVERLGNRLPDPVMLFVWLILFLMLLSAVGAWAGWQASLPFAGDEPPAFATLEQGRAVFRAESLFSEANLQRLFTEMPRTLMAFPPLGIVIVIMLGAAIAERSGLFSALIRGSLMNVPLPYLTPVVAVVGMVSHHASDAGYIVFIPLAALLYASVGRHPLAGLAAAFAAVAGGFAGNVFPGQLDVMLFGFTEAAARIVDPGWRMNPLGIWWLQLGVVLFFTPFIWYLTDRVVEPRLGAYGGGCSPALQEELERAAVTDAERRGLRRAGAVALLVLAVVAGLSLHPDFAPLVNREESGIARAQPFFSGLIALISLLFAATGIAYGAAVGTIRRPADAVEMMVEGVRVIAPYIVFAFFAAHFVAMFNWSRLGPITAINGAAVLEAMALPKAVLLLSVLVFSSFLDLFIGSATAKWSALAPVVVPMFMLLGISPEMTTGAYRMGDSFTNIMTPLMSYFPLILMFARRWDPKMGTGSLLALMLPYALVFMVLSLVMIGLWAHFEWPLGPGAPVRWTPPA